MSDWENDDFNDSAPAAVPKKKWDDEDADDDEIKESWEEEDEKPKPAPAPIKKVPLAQKIKEREAAEAAKKKALAEQRAEEERLRNESPAERKARLREVELESDMKNAVDLFGGVSLTEDKDLTSKDAEVLTMKPKTRSDFDTYSEKLSQIILNNSNSPHFAYFVDELTRKLVAPLKDLDVRKTASTLTTIANEKQRAEKEKGGKKSKGKAKPVLSAKSVGKVDTIAYVEALDDEFDDFM